jgi:hypothetical protein
MFLSMILFSPMAVVLAETIATIIQNRVLPWGMPLAAMKAEVRAKGNANTEWENLIILR